MRLLIAEIRISKSETNPNDQGPKFKKGPAVCDSVSVIGILRFEFVSSFGFRASSFPVGGIGVRRPYPAVSRISSFDGTILIWYTVYRETESRQPGESRLSAQ
jgi:hypothetical protein